MTELPFDNFPEEFNNTDYWDLILPASFIIPPVEEKPVETPLKPNQTKRMCGYPINYDRNKCLLLNTTSQDLSSCEYKGGSAVFGSVICLLSLVILLANSLVVFVVFKKRKMRTNYNFIKASLAVADWLCGFVLLGFVLPNLIYVRNSTEEELIDNILNHNSVQDVFTGAILTLSIQSSLLHLMFLSIDRFIAIKFPFRHRQQKYSTLMMSLVSLWIISALCSFVPAAFEDTFGFTFQPVLFFSLITLKPALGGEIGYQGPLYLMIVFGVPYVVMVVISILTGVVIYQRLKFCASTFGRKATGNKQTTSTQSQTLDKIDSTSTQAKEKRRFELKPEISIFVTLIVMIGAFSITLLPALVIQILYFSNALDCSNYSIPYTLAFYIGMANSFTNAVIYSIREERFRRAVAEIFELKISKPIGNVQSSPSTKHTDLQHTSQRA